MATLAEGRKAVACSHPLDPKSTQYRSSVSGSASGLSKVGSQMTAVRPDVRPIAIASSLARTLSRTCRVRIMWPTLRAPTTGLRQATRGGCLGMRMGLPGVSAMIAWSGVGIVGRGPPPLLPLPRSHHVRHDTRKGSGRGLRADEAIASTATVLPPVVCASRGLQCPVLGGGLRSLSRN